MNQQENKSLSKKQRKILIGSIITVLVLLIFIVGTMIYTFSNNVMDNLKGEVFTPEEVGIEPEIDEQFNQYDGKIKNVLLIGIDSDLNKGLPQRSDSMIIVPIDDQHKTIKMSSLMRDTLVEIDGHGKDKLNHAYAFGGAKLLLKTINQNFKVNLQDYILVDFDNLISIVDAIGGIDLYITKDEVKYANINIKDVNKLNKSNIEKLKPISQKVHVNGAQALSYARIRYLDSDYKRAGRQRTVLIQIYQKLLDAPLLDLPNIALDLSQYAKTSLTQGEIIDIALKSLGKEMPVDGLRFPTENTSVESTKGMWHLKWDEEETIKEIHDWIFKDIKPASSDE